MFIDDFNYFVRCKDVALRKEYVKLIDSVREYSGEVKIFSSMHISGERTLQIIEQTKIFKYMPLFLFIELEQLTGIAAILRFPMPELDEDNDSDED